MDVLTLRLFLRIAECGGVALAARDLHLSPATASARLAKLEADLGVRLFHRTTRAVSLTLDGTAFLPYAKEALELLESGRQAIRGDQSRIKGRLRLAMPGSFGRLYIIPQLHRFQKIYPDIELDLRLSDEITDIVTGGFDLIIRNAVLADSHLIARKLADDQRILVASPAYLSENGCPQSLADLSRHRCIALGNGHQWIFENGEKIDIGHALVVNDGEAMRMMIETGMGIGMKSRWNAQQSLSTGNLCQILPEAPLRSETSIWLLYEGRQFIAPKIRVMIDFLVRYFAPIPPWAQTLKHDQFPQAHEQAQTTQKGE